MISEWLKVMLEEISRKRTEAEQARLEEQTRSDVIESKSCAREKNIGDAE